MNNNNNNNVLYCKNMAASPTEGAEEKSLDLFINTQTVNRKKHPKLVWIEIDHKGKKTLLYQPVGLFHFLFASV